MNPTHPHISAANVDTKMRWFCTFVLTAALFLPLVSAIVLPSVQAAEIKKCQDIHGNWYYGNFADQACAYYGTVINLNNSGNVINEDPPPPTQAELDQQEKQKKADEQRKQALLQQLENDKILVKTYGSEDVIITTRDRKVKAIDSNLAVTQKLRDGIIADVAELKTRPQTFKIKNLIEEREKAITAYEEVVTQSSIERDRLAAKYAQILKDFRIAIDRLSKN